MKTSLYHERILDLADNTEYVRTIERPDREASGTNVLCGDRVSIQLEMDRDEIRRLYYQVRGCLLCRASCTESVSYTHPRAHETPEQLVCRLLLEKQKLLITH